MRPRTSAKPCGGLGDAGKNLEQGGLPRPVAADDSHHFALANVKGNILERPDVGGIAVGGRRLPRPEETQRGGRGAGQDVAQGKVTLALANAVALAQIFNVNDGVGH